MSKIHQPPGGVPSHPASECADRGCKKTNEFNMPTVLCTTCGCDTPMTGTKLCDRCWEFEHRLGDYLEIGVHARNIVRLALRKASER